MIANNKLVLMVDDDEEDVYLTKRAFCGHMKSLVFKSVPDSPSMFNYLYRRGEFDALETSNIPQLILLDINIPKENGFEILKKLRQDPEHGHIPVTMLTTSTAEHDVRQAYRLGASSFISKSVSASEMKRVAEHFCNYWFDLAHVPDTQPRN